jgi:membrane protease YdiL (CAAX protease family)
VPLIALALVVASALTIAASGSYLGWGAATYVVLLVNCLAVGVVEETMFRGLLWVSLPQAWSASRVLLVTSACFGAVHVANGFTTGLWGVALLQACVVSVTGLGLGALRLRTGWLGAGVVTHMFIDAGLVAYGIALAHARTIDPGLHRYPVWVLLCALVLLSLYVTLAVAGIAVLVRTFRSERQARRLAATGLLAGPESWPPGPPPTLVG